MQMFRTHHSPESLVHATRHSNARTGVAEHRRTRLVVVMQPCLAPAAEQPHSVVEAVKHSNARKLVLNVLTPEL